MKVNLRESQRIRKNMREFGENPRQYGKIRENSKKHARILSQFEKIRERPEEYDGIQNIHRGFGRI